jgi:hypothetical protein
MARLYRLWLKRGIYCGGYSQRQQFYLSGLAQTQWRVAGMSRLLCWTPSHLGSRRRPAELGRTQDKSWSMWGTDRTKTVRMYASQSTNHPALFAERARAPGRLEALGSSTNLASHFNQAWSRPHKGQLETGSLSGRVAKLSGCISIPVEISRPVSGHLTLRTPIVCPSPSLREL